MSTNCTPPPKYKNKIENYVINVIIVKRVRQIGFGENT
jgi:hypothetical protein